MIHTHSISFQLITKYKFRQFLLNLLVICLPLLILGFATPPLALGPLIFWKAAAAGPRHAASSAHCRFQLQVVVVVRRAQKKMKKKVNKRWKLQARRQYIEMKSHELGQRCKSESILSYLAPKFASLKKDVFEWHFKKWLYLCTSYWQWFSFI